MDFNERRLSRQPSKLSYGKISKNGTSNLLGNSDLDKDCRIIFVSMFNNISKGIKTKQDLNRALFLGGRNITKRELDELWNLSSKNIHLQEFHDLCEGIKITTKEDILKAFRKIDVNNDGFIAREELARIMTKMGDKMSQKEVEDFLEVFDTDRDGRLNYGEYVTMVMKMQEESHRAAERNYQKFMRESKTETAIESGRSEQRNSLRKNSMKTEDDENSIMYGSDLDDNEDANEDFEKSLNSQVWNGPDKLPTVEKPKNFKDWSACRRHGSFYFLNRAEESADIIIKTQSFTIEVQHNTLMWMSVEPVWTKETDLNREMEKTESYMDMMLFILNKEGKLVAYSDEKGARGKSCLTVELKKGKYRVIAYTSGSKYPRAATDLSKFKSRRSSSLGIELITQMGDGYLMTPAFREVLCDIFKSFDSKGCGLMDRHDFELYTKLTCGEEEVLLEEDWGIVLDRVQTTGGMMTMQGFLELHEMDAMDSCGDEEDFWDTLFKLGYDRKLHLVKASQYLLEIYTEFGDIKVDVENISAFQEELKPKLVDIVKKQGVHIKSKNNSDVTVHVMTTEVDAILVVENEGPRTVVVTVDCSKSENIISHRGSLNYSSKVSGKTSMIFHHLHPAKGSIKWSFLANESVRRP